MAKYSVRDIVYATKNIPVSLIFTQALHLKANCYYEILQVDHILNDYVVCMTGDTRTVKIDITRLDADSYLTGSGQQIAAIDSKIDFAHPCDRRIEELMEKKSMSVDDVLEILEKWA